MFLMTTRSRNRSSFLLDCNCLRYGLSLTVVCVLAFERDLNRLDVFASQLPSFKVWTRATWLLRVRIDRVLGRATLRRN